MAGFELDSAFFRFHIGLMTPERAPQGPGPVGPGGPGFPSQRPPSPPIFNAPSVVMWIMGLTIGAHFMRLLLSDQAEFWLFHKLAYIPARYLDASLFNLDPVAGIISPLGYTLLHADFLHLFMNMGFLLAFGSVIARRMNVVSFLAIYGISALVGAFTVQFVEPTAVTPVIGASGAVSGTVGAVASLALFRQRNVPPPPRPFNRLGVSIIFVIIWFITSVGIGLVPAEALGLPGRIAWEAHLGGFIAGFLLIRFLDGVGRSHIRPIT